ncbi:hypothetical protein HMPREF1631_00605 [Arcanobacterium sp. S3PF19]|nr:hypothetical protein HMPREF1631_00605 [Arcanobacterium sp. S3PF19]
MPSVSPSLFPFRLPRPFPHPARRGKHARKKMGTQCLSAPQGTCSGASEWERAAHGIQFLPAF